VCWPRLARVSRLRCCYSSGSEVAFGDWRVCDPGSKELREGRTVNLLLRVSLCGVLGIVVSACSPAASSTAPPQVSTTTVQRGQIQRLISSSGNVRAKAQIAVQPQASGRVQEV